MNPLEKASLVKPVKKSTGDFVQLSRGYITETRRLARKCLPAHELLFFLVERMQRNNIIVVSQATLCELLGYSRTTIQKAVRILSEENWIQVLKVSSANAYIVNSRVFWRTHNGKRFASFYAEVIASESEQTQTVEELETQELKHIPTVRADELRLSGSEQLPPPDQLDLPDTLDADAVPAICEREETDAERIERLGQTRLIE